KVMGNKAKKELRETNLSEWRRLVCGDLSSAFRPYNGEEMKFPDPVERDEFVATIHQPQYKDQPDGYKNLTREEQKQTNENPKATPYMPKQEQGIKDSMPFPYPLLVDGYLEKKNNSFHLNLEARDHVFGKKTQGAPYIVYAPGKYRKAGTEEYQDVRT